MPRPVPPARRESKFGNAGAGQGRAGRRRSGRTQGRARGVQGCRVRWKPLLRRPRPATRATRGAAPAKFARSSRTRVREEFLPAFLCSARISSKYNQHRHALTGRRGPRPRPAPLASPRVRAHSKARRTTKGSSSSEEAWSSERAGASRTRAPCACAPCACAPRACTCAHAACARGCALPLRPVAAPCGSINGIQT